jgi:hypothetical protein
MSRDLVIAISALPPRPRRLLDHEISTVFGGCAKEYESCEFASECCPPDSPYKATCEKLRCGKVWTSTYNP